MTMKTLLYRFGFERFQWYRHWVGGHWERWIVDLTGQQSEWWFLMDKWRNPLGNPCSKHGAPRPLSVCRGTPVCEQWC
jgi:hypothetical protein